MKFISSKNLAQRLEHTRFSKPQQAAVPTRGEDDEEVIAVLLESQLRRRAEHMIEELPEWMMWS